MKIIGLTGTAGAGKDTVAEIICKQYGFSELSTSEFVRHLARFVYDLPPTNLPVRDQLFDVATFMRANVSSAASVEFCIKRAKALGLEKMLITGLRTMGESDCVRKHGGFIVAVDADAKIRFERITKRKRDSEALKTFEQFLVQDQKENQGLSARGDARGIAAITQYADVTIRNDDDLASLQSQVSGTLKQHLL